MEKADILFFMLIYWVLNVPIVQAANANVYSDKTDLTMKIQNEIKSLDYSNTNTAKAYRAKIVADLRPLSAKLLAALYRKLPREAHDFRYACLLLAAYEHKENIDLNIEAVESFKKLV